MCIICIKDQAPANQEELLFCLVEVVLEAFPKHQIYLGHSAFRLDGKRPEKDSIVPYGNAVSVNLQIHISFELTAQINRF